MDRVHTIHHIGQRLPDGFTWSGERFDEETNDIQALLILARHMERHVRSNATKKWAIEKPKLEDCAVFTSLIQRVQISKKTIRNARKKLEVPMPAAMPCKIRCRTCKELVTILMLPRRNTHASLKPTYLRESVWKELHTKIMKPAFKKGIISVNHYNLVYKFILMPKAMNIPDATAVANKEWKTRENTVMTPDENQKQKRGDQ